MIAIGPHRAPRRRSLALCTSRMAVLVLALIVAAPVRALERDVICTGDCNFDGSASIDELLRGVAISLNRVPLDTCVGFDASSDGAVAVNELIGGVMNAQRGCPEARFVPGECELPLPDGQEAGNVSCGRLIAREDRALHNGRTVSLAVVILRATGESRQPDPFVFLTGGPGGWALDGYLASLTPSFAAPIQSARDIVIFDQRGTGRSRPAFNCPEVLPLRDSFTELLGPEQEAARDLRNARACYDRLIVAGEHPEAYSSAAGARDIAELMTALGYERFNLYGLSYGTRVALTTLRDVPNQRIRSVVLDSALPLQVHLVGGTAGAAVERSLRLLFADCAANPACAGSYPELEQTTFELVDRLNAEPVTVHPKDPAGQPFEVIVTGHRMVRLLGLGMQSNDLIPFLPLFVDSVANDNNALLTAALGQLGAPELFSPGLAYAVLCNEETPFNTPEVIAMENQGVHPVIARALSADPRGTQCAWQSPPVDPIENEPVSSDVPTLVLAGQYDTSTPPAWGQLAAETLSHSRYVEFRGFGHVVLGQQVAPTGPPSCAMQVIAAFVDQPDRPPDTSCVDALPPPNFVGS